MVEWCQTAVYRSNTQAAEIRSTSDHLSVLPNQSQTARMIIEPMRKQPESESGVIGPQFAATSRPIDSLVCRCGHGTHVLVLFCAYYHAALPGAIMILMADAPLM